MLPLDFHFSAILFALAIFGGMWAFMEFGRHIGIRRLTKHGEDARAGVGVIDGAVFAVLSLLIGFTFSGAAARFDSRRATVAHAANAIGSAWYTVDMLPESAQPPVRNDFRRYVDALVSSYGERATVANALSEPPAVASARHDLWSHSIAGVLQPDGERARMLLLPALNTMFGVVDEERHARRIHPPLTIYVMLGIAALVAALFAGLGIANHKVHNRLLTIGVAATIGMAVYVIVELEYPRLGVIRVNDMDSALVELRASMK
jgi:hypothetical protein